MTSSLRGPDATEAGYDQTGRWQHSLQTPSPALFFTTNYWDLLSLQFWKLSCTCPTLFPTFSNKNAASNLVYICSRCRGLQELLCLPALPSWYSYAEPPYTCLYFSRFLLPSFLNLTVQSLWCSNTSTVILITNIFITLRLWQALGSTATNIPVINELLSAWSFTIQQLACGLWSKLNMQDPCIGSTPNSNNSNINKKCKTSSWEQRSTVFLTIPKSITSGALFLSYTNTLLNCSEVGK